MEKALSQLREFAEWWERLSFEEVLMVDNPIKKSIEPKEPIVVPLDDPNVPVSLVPIPEEPPHSKILREYDGLESNIPIHHYYWRIRP